MPTHSNVVFEGRRVCSLLLVASEMPSRRIGRSGTQSVYNTSLALADNTSLLLHDNEIVTKVLPYSGFNGLLLASVGLERTDKA